MNALDKVTFKKYIQSFDFTTLFNELGWDYLNEDLSKKAGDKIFSLKAVAHKEGFRIFVCNPDEEGKIPDSSLRKKIHTEISRLYFEHLIIFVDRNKTTQVWQLIIREHGKPQGIKQVTWYRHQEPELLYQRLSGVFFTIDETDKLTIVDVTHRLKENFGANAEKVTKKFYDVFKTEHTRFLKFLKGIEDNIARDWYASLMLNRLMFCYFIQKKGFLNNDKNYLRNKLKEVQAEKGKDKFFKFYYDFLKTLFHEGLGSPNHSEELKKIIGNIPYLNGGLFDMHKLETEYPKIQLDDAAFEHIFKFFDEWEWHLDTRITTPGKDINPDVIGYIFEKYINERSSKGAYYTKEDITDYIGKNCIIPFLFDEIKRSYPKSLNPDGEIWKLLQTDPDKYIYDAVKHGISVNIHETDPQKRKLDKLFELPDEIAIGLDVSKPNLLERRKDWNKPAPPEYGLPTEIWREVVERRRRYTGIKTKIFSGEINNINDFITYNLNIRQFAQDVIENTDDPEFIRHFYKALTTISILDPTCGSGAFLFAAINILEPLYEACLQCMENFVADAKNSSLERGQRGVSKYKFFEDTLAIVKSPEHPNLQYFIFKNIILKNIYGVDIMHEAVEIAKLRLFLKLVATVDVDYKKPNLGLEPLPDIDFNIRAGNTLVGFAKIEEVEKVFKLTFYKKEIDAIKEQAEMVKMAYERFKDSQVIIDSPAMSGAKKDLEERLRRLNDKLNIYLAQPCGIDIERKPKDFEIWKASHQPFHWFAEFYGIIQDEGGFDVIIGNPPYVEYSKVKKTYSIQGYRTERCGNLYAFCMERSLNISRDEGKFGMIVPFSSTSTFRMNKLVDHMISKGSLWVSNYDERPTHLFDGVCLQTAIILININRERFVNNVTSLMHWTSDQRKELFTSRIQYQQLNIAKNDFYLFKVSHEIELQILNKINTNKRTLPICQQITGNPLYYRTSGGRYFKLITNFPPLFSCKGGRKISSKQNELYFQSCMLRDITVAILSSSLFYWYWRIYSNCRDLTMHELNTFPDNIENLNNKAKESLVQLIQALMIDYKNNSVRKKCYYKATGEVIYDEFYPKHSKPIIDEIDKVLAQHYGFTDEELDFIINYDIKYRMGKELEGEDEE